MTVLPMVVTPAWPRPWHVAGGQWAPTGEGGPRHHPALGLQSCCSQWVK